MKNHKHYQAGYRAHYGTSFSPEKRAESECKFFDEIMVEFEQLGVSEEGKQKFEKLFLLSLSAKSRCLSSMIAGPAKFPVERARKASERERRVSDELLAYIGKVRKAVDKKNNPEKYASDAIRSDDDNALEKLKTKLVALKKAQEQMKQCNAIIKSKKITNKAEALAEILENKERAEAILKPDCFGVIGFPKFALTNNGASIRATEARIAELESAAKLQTKEFQVGDVKVVENAEELRIQFFFNGKPAQEIIDLMKSSGFKWSPSQGCWQRLWNNNCVSVVQHRILPILKNAQN